MKKFILTFLRILITALILFFIFRKIDFAGTLSIFMRSNIFYLVLALASFFLISFFVAFRWYLVLKMYNFSVSLANAFRIYMIAFFFNNFLPSTVGMDVIRGAYISKDKKRLPDVISTLIIERWIGFFGIVLYISAVPLLFTKEINIAYFLPFSIIGLSASIIFIISLWSQPVFNFFEKLFAKITIWGIGEKINSLYRSLSTIKNFPKQFFFNLGLSIVVQIVFVFTNFFIVKAQSLDIPIKQLFLYVPLISVISMVPITINGLGLREAAYLTFFGKELQTQAVALSLTQFLISVVFSLAGGVLFLFDNNKDIKEKI